MEIIQAIKETRSTRIFSNETFPIDIVKSIVELAGQAPSGLNKQPWLYCIVSNLSIKETIKKECEYVETAFYNRMGKKANEFLSMDISIKKPFLTEAPYLVCLFGDVSAPYYKESLWISVGWFMLAAKSMGLSSLTYTPERMDFLNEILGVSGQYFPEVIFPLGYGKKGGLKSRKNFNDIGRIYE